MYIQCVFEPDVAMLSIIAPCFAIFQCVIIYIQYTFNVDQYICNLAYANSLTPLLSYPKSRNFQIS